MSATNSKGGNIEKTYADALFALIAEESDPKADERIAYDGVLSQLSLIGAVIDEAPEFIKFMSTPTIAFEDKLKLIDTAFGEGALSRNILNFMKLLAVKGRTRNYGGIYRAFRAMYNDKFGIAEIVVTSPCPLDESIKAKIASRMSSVTGKTVSVIEKVDKTLIGGIVVDYGNTRFDGSVKTRLAELKKDISTIIV